LKFLSVSQDFLVWQRGLGTAFMAANLAQWSTTFDRTTASAAAAAVPEPAAMSMILIASIVTAAAQRRLR
jgi:hypothetical protein